MYCIYIYLRRKQQNNDFQYILDLIGKDNLHTPAKHQSEIEKKPGRKSPRVKIEDFYANRSGVISDKSNVAEEHNDSILKSGGVCTCY